jgi:selenocysteine-specific elongation factor
MRDVVVGTAGHIDHGKTLLVKAITGMDADRLEEEKRRGITLDIGFATLLEERGTLHFVDLPGHERFIKNMLAGATGIDVFLLVVAADESVMPQTVEHADILRLLGVKRGVVALTKTDLVDRDTLDLATLELSEFLASRGFGGLPVVPVSAVTGAGISDLVDALYAAAEQCGEPSAERPFRLPVDRVFTVRGFGTVVTGTCVDGTLAVDSLVEVYPRVGTSRVRGMQVFGGETRSVRAGQRVALNVPDLKHEGLCRGHVAAEPGSMWPSRLLDVRVEVLASARHPLRSGLVCRLHIHTQEVEAHLHLAGAGALAPGEKGIAQMRCPEEVSAWPGDRFILRLPSPDRTVAGGEVLLVARRKARWSRSLERRLLPRLEAGTRLQALLAEAGALGVSPEEAAARLGIRRPEADPDAVRWGGGAWWLDPQEAEGWVERASSWLEARHGGKTPLAWTPRQEFLGRWARLLGGARSEALLGALVERGRVEAEGDRVRPAGHKVSLTPAQARAKEAVLAALSDRPFAVRTGKELEELAGKEARSVLPLMTGAGELVRFGGDFFLRPEALDHVRVLLQTRAAGGDTGIAVPEFKDLLGITRKYAMPLLEHLDDLKWTRREGEGRRILLKGSGT